MLGNWTNKNRWAVTNTIGCFSYKYPWALWKMRNVRPWFKWSPQKWVWWGSTREQSVQIPLYGALLVPHTCRYRYICASNRHCIEDTYFFSSGATFYLFGATFFLAHRFFILARLFLLLRDFFFILYPLPDILRAQIPAVVQQASKMAAENPNDLEKASILINL